MKIPAGCLQHAGGIAFVQITFEKISRHQGGGTSVGVEDEQGAVFIRPGDIHIADGGTIQEPETKLAKAGLRRQRSAVNRGEQLRKALFKAVHGKRQAFAVAMTENAGCIRDALQQHFVTAEDLVHCGESVSAVGANILAGREALRAAGAFPFRAVVGDTQDAECGRG